MPRVPFGRRLSVVDAERRDLADGGWILHDPSFFAREEADALFSELVAELAWESREIVLFGKRILQPRLVAWAGSVPYRYSGQTLEPSPFVPSAERVLERTVERTGVPFNHLLANRYRDGRDSMGFHSDDEPELGPSPTVATVSFGETRRFVVVSRRGKERLEYRLARGSLLVMGGACQERYRHAVPKEPGITKERISLTFRKIAPFSPSGDT